MTDATHLLIRASAGTGKTFRLTHRMIALLSQDVPPERVLASTFTRKAAGEILQRLVAQLAEAVVDPARRQQMNERLAQEPGAASLDEAGARRVLLSVLRQLQRIEVHTLDAFFHRLARVHAWELDLPPGWTLAAGTDEDRLCADAVARVVARADRGELLALLASLAGGPPPRSVHAHLVSLVEKAHGLLLQSEAGAWEAIGPPPELPAAEIERASAELRGTSAPLTGKGTPNKTWEKALAKAKAALEAGDGDGFRGVGLVGKVVEGEVVYSGNDIEAPLADAIHTLLRALAVSELRLEARRVLDWHRLLLDYDRAFTELQRERRLLRFEDVPRALRRGGVPGEEATLALRLDGAPLHLLLDEFQDTSTQQWEVLVPLVARALAEPARHVFVVGDAKQSVYGWRQGEPRLMDALARRKISTAGLDESRRSAQAVIDAVNTVFERLEANPALGADAAALQAARSWHGAPHFPRHSTAMQGLPGAVRLWQVPTPDGRAEPRRARLAEAAADLVRRLVAADPEASVGVLVRRNDPIPRLIHALRERGVLASGEGGNALTDSAAVQVLLSLLLLADHPGDSAAAFHVGTSPLGAVLGVDPRPRASRERVAAEVRAALLRDGYGAWLQARREQVDACADFGAWDRRRVAQLVDLGHAWDARATLRPGDFVRHVQRTDVEDPAASRVRVLTVHKAKGLEFDAVVCPELERDPFGRFGPAGLIARREDPERPISAVFTDVDIELARQARHEPLVKFLEFARQRTLRDDLCVLYVALTRAKRRVDLLVSSADPPALSFASVLRAALVMPDAPAPDDVRATVLWRRVDKDADELLAEEHAPNPVAAAVAAVEAAAPSPAPPAAAPPIAWRTDGPRHVLRRKAPSSREGGGRALGSELLGHGGATARRRGTLVHEWLSALEWLENGPPPDAELLARARRRLARDGVPDAGIPLATWLAELHAALGRPRARELLSRATTVARGGQPSAAPELWRERAFLLVEREDGEDILVPGAFDRVVVLRDAAGAPLAAEIVDFKTDRVKGADAPPAQRLDALVRHYAPQMQAYRRALAALTGLPPAAIACRLLFLDADEVRDVPA